MGKRGKEAIILTQMVELIKANPEVNWAEARKSFWWKRYSRSKKVFRSRTLFYRARRLAQGLPDYPRKKYAHVKNPFFAARVGFVYCQENSKTPEMLETAVQKVFKTFADLPEPRRTKNIVLFNLLCQRVRLLVEDPTRRQIGGMSHELHMPRQNPG